MLSSCVGTVDSVGFANGRAGGWYLGLVGCVVLKWGSQGELGWGANWRSALVVCGTLTWRFRMSTWTYVSGAQGVSPHDIGSTRRHEFA